MTPVLAYLRNDIDSSIQCLHFESDSPSGQYRNRSNAYLMSTIPFNMGYSDISWNYYEAGHGKGAPDGVGAAMKRNADDLVSDGRDLLNARNLYDELSPSTSIKLFLVTAEDIAEIDKLVPSSIPPVPGLMNVHQIKCAVDGIIDLFRPSCVCSRCNTECTCTPVCTIMKPAKKRPEPRKARTKEKHRTPGTLESTAANKRDASHQSDNTDSAGGDLFMSCDAVVSSGDSMPEGDKVAELHAVLQHISPMPKCKTVRQRKRTAEHAEVLTASPFKKRLLQKKARRCLARGLQERRQQVGLQQHAARESSSAD